MKTVKKIFTYFRNVYKYYIIRNELKKNFKYRGIKNKNYLNLLTKSLYKSSKIVKKDIDDTNKRIMEYENTILVGGIINFINKYYNKKENELKTRENKIKIKEDKLQKKESKNNKIPIINRIK